MSVDSQLRRRRRRPAPVESMPVPPQPPLQASKGKGALTALVAAGVIVLLVLGVTAYRTTAAGQGSQAADKAQQQEIEAFINRYFTTWSNQDIKGYGSCFLSNSCVQFITAGGQVSLYGLQAFLASQDDVFRRGGREIETPESIDITMEANMARVVVYWKLLVEGRQVYGYDHFTLMKSRGKWGIVNLISYETKTSE